MPDTAVLKTPQGWIDRDNPSKFYRVRWEARNARRIARGFYKAPANSSTTTTQVNYSFPANLPVTASVTTLSSLQSKLYDRMTLLQGVSSKDAWDIITNNGYNKAASYGHMRAAGANHSEACLVIAMNTPEISLRYGRNRALDMNHTDALAEALKVTSDVDRI